MGMGALMSKDIKPFVLYPWNVIEPIKILMVWFLCANNPLILYYMFFVNFMLGNVCYLKMLLNLS